MIKKIVYILFFKDVDFIEKQQLKLDVSYPSVDFRRYQNDKVCNHIKKKPINYYYLFLIYSLTLLFINQLILFEIFYYIDYLDQL
jgi:hypothetical protein